MTAPAHFMCKIGWVLPILWNALFVCVLANQN